MSISRAEVPPSYEKYKNLRKQEISEIFEWLKQNPYLPMLTELQVILFLDSCLFNVDFAKKAIINYFSFKAKSDLFVMVDENLVKRSSSVLFVGILPNKTPKNERVGVIKFLDANPEKYNPEECAKYMLNYLNIYLYLCGPSNGFIFIMDSANFSFGHLWKMKLSLMRQCFHYMQEAAPWMLKEIHLVNVLSVTKHFYVCARPFIKKEINDMIRIHSDSIESLYEYVPTSCLPEEYGGELDSCRVLNEKNSEIVLENMKLLEWLHSQNIDESQRKVNEKKGLFDTIYNYFV